MKKRIMQLMIILLSILTFSTPIVASANESDLDLMEIQSSSYSKIVTRKYPVSVYYNGKLPASIVVTEIKLRQYYSGRLSLIDYYIDRNQEVVATYRGTMYPTNSGVTPLQIRK